MQAKENPSHPLPRAAAAPAGRAPQALTLPLAYMWPVNDFSHRCWPSLPSQGRQLAGPQNLRPPERKEELSCPCHGQPTGRRHGALPWVTCHRDQAGSGLLESTQWVCPQPLVTVAGVPSPVGSAWCRDSVPKSTEVPPFTGQQTEASRREQLHSRRRRLKSRFPPPFAPTKPLTFRASVALAVEWE